MTKDLLTSVRAEIADLDADLSANASYRRLKVLQAVLHEYEGSDSPQRSNSGVATRGPVRKTTRKPSPEREQALGFVRSFLKDRTTPTPIREIFSSMELFGIRLGGKNPINNLSAILSNNDEFKSYGRDGWILVANDELAKIHIDIDEKAKPPSVQFFGLPQPPRSSEEG